MTGTIPTMDWIYHLDLNHMLQLNKIPTNCNLWLYKKIDTLVKIVSNIEYIITYINDHINREYCNYVLKEEANTSSLSSIPEFDIASQVSASATIHITNPPTVSEERDSPFLLDSFVLENLEAASLLKSMKAAQQLQIRTNDVNTQVLYRLMDKMSETNNTNKVDKSFNCIITTILLE